MKNKTQVHRGYLIEQTISNYTGVTWYSCTDRRVSGIHKTLTACIDTIDRHIEELKAVK